ncbi:TRH-like receptor [Daphnia sinensis]|uniref:Thyrotropin-releasing hormone receptor n=1 Tax=Daphnia sinensis TaxID=1820382 RepID=A0AAD5KNE1_9CRUS|nr:TRH-like receptor [Daphnia sinensis]
MDVVCSQVVNDTLNAIRSGVLTANGTDDAMDEYSVLEKALGANCTDWWLSSINRTSMDFLGDDTGGPNSSFSDKEENPSYFSRDYRLVGTLFQGLILLVGVLGNLLVVMVVYRTRSMHSPTNCYLVSLAAADCVVLIASVPNEILSYYVIGSQWIWGPIGCAVFVFLQNLGINASSLSLTAFTVERYIAICHPMKAQSVCTVKRAKKIVGGVWAFAFCYSSPWLGLTITEPIHYKGFQTVERCAMKLSREEYLGYFFADIVVFYLVPLLISCILYGLIARVLFNGHFNKYPEVCRHDNQSSVDPTKSSRVQVVKMLVVVVVIFATLWLPYRGMLVYNSFATMHSKPSFMDLWFLMFAKTCVYINSAINPILYTAMSIKFRRAFQRILLCGRSSLNQQRSPGTQMRHLGHLA